MVAVLGCQSEVPLPLRVPALRSAPQEPSNLGRQFSIWQPSAHGLDHN